NIAICSRAAPVAAAMQGNAAVLLLLSADACGRARRAARRGETGSAQENQRLGAHRPNGPAGIWQSLLEFLLQIRCRCSKRTLQTQPKATGRRPVIWPRR